MMSHTVRSSRATAAVISSGWVCHSRVEPSTSASSNVTVPVGSSLPHVAPVHWRRVRTWINFAHANGHGAAIGGKT